MPSELGAAAPGASRPPGRAAVPLPLTSFFSSSSPSTSTSTSRRTTPGEVREKSGTTPGVFGDEEGGAPGAEGSRSSPRRSARRSWCSRQVRACSHHRPPDSNHLTFVSRLISASAFRIAGTLNQGISGTTSALIYIGSPFAFPWESRWGTSMRKRERAFGESAANFFEEAASFRSIRPGARGSATMPPPLLGLRPPHNFPDDGIKIDRVPAISSKEIVDVIAAEDDPAGWRMNVGYFIKEMPSRPSGAGCRSSTSPAVSSGVCQREVRGCAAHAALPLSLFSGKRMAMSIPRRAAMRARVFGPRR